MPDIGVSPAESEAESEAESALRQRMARLDQLRAMCEDSLEDLIQGGTGLAVAVAQQAEMEINRGFSEYHGTMVLKGGLPATKGFAQASQCVRLSILLLRQVVCEGWWEDATAPVVAARDKAAAKRERAEAEIAERAESAERPEKAEQAERVERVERVEDFGRDIGPALLAAEIARLREGLAEVSAATGIMLPDPTTSPLPSYAAKPQHPGDATPTADGEPQPVFTDPPD